MGWFGKKEEKEIMPDLPEFESVSMPKLPRLPELPNLPELPEKTFSLPELNEEDNLVFSRNDLPLLDDVKINRNATDFRTDVNRMKEFRKSEDVLKESPSLQLKESKRVKENEPIYIRLDKFQTTQQAFYEIKNKIDEIEKTLVKLKEIKEREDKELEEWEKETQLIKARLNAIDTHLFGNL